MDCFCKGIESLNHIGQKKPSPILTTSVNQALTICRPMCTRPCVFADHYVEAFRAVRLILQLSDNLNFKGFIFFLYTLQALIWGSGGAYSYARVLLVFC